MISIPALIKGRRNYTLHSHTQYCDGRAPISIMAEAAVAAGMELYGFTPHSPIPFLSPCNMDKGDVEAYFADVDTVRARYSDSGCTFLRGMEIDYIDEDWGPANEYFASLGLDYCIGSVHFIPDQSGEPVDIDGSFDNFKLKMARHFRGDIDYVVETYYRQCEAMLAAGGFDILGHLDKVGQNAAYFAPGIEEGCHYKGLIDGYIDKVIASGIAVELNTKALAAHGRFFPGACYLPRLLKAGVVLPVNSDAHYPELINAGRSEAYSLIHNIEKELSL